LAQAMSFEQQPPWYCKRYAMPASMAFSALALAAASGDSFGAHSKEPSCSQDLAMMAFAQGDISQARAELAIYKDGSRASRECASGVWKQGIAALPLPRAWEVGPAGGSRVLERFGSKGCEARAEDGTWLDIPRLQELLVCIPAGERMLVLEQDGFLRAFDMPTVLWPAGYFLALWAAAHCHLLKGRVLELGAGVGAPSIAASLCGGNTVLATDKVPHGLVNIRTNAMINGASVEVRLLDWDNDADVRSVVADGQFDVVLGSGLAPHRWADRLCGMLTWLLRPTSGRAVLSHGVDDLDLAKGCQGNDRLLVEVTVTGDEYGLQTRWGTSSEFEIVVLQHADSGEL